MSLLKFSDLLYTLPNPSFLIFLEYETKTFSILWLVNDDFGCLYFDFDSNFRAIHI